VSSVHPDILQTVALLRDAGLIPPQAGDAGEVRGYLERINRLAAQDSVPLPGERLLGLAVNGREVLCKLYPPEDAVSSSLLVYCHGGGFRHGTLAGWDAPLRQLVRDSGVAVLSIGYALSPEYRFPIAFEEIGQILREVIDAQQIDGHPACKLALGGDSAGANLALGAALSLRDAEISAVRHLTLFYGSFSRDVSAPSWQRHGGFGGHGLSAGKMTEYWKSYLGDCDADWRAEPLNARLDGLPPTRLIVGDLDPLLDENAKLAEKLEAAGVEVALITLPGIIHGVIRFNEVAPVVRDIIRAEALALTKALAG
jgi:acetyl esterase